MREVIEKRMAEAASEMIGLYERSVSVSRVGSTGED
jgi:hypothetical protein